MTRGALASVSAAAEASQPQPSPQTPAPGLAQAGPQDRPVLRSACRVIALRSARAPPVDYLDKAFRGGKNWTLALFKVLRDLHRIERGAF